ncbi:MAG: aminotransferase class IV [Alphaproteobacteria bacterium]
MTIQATKPVEAATDFGSGAAYVNGEFVPVADATISILDFGVTRSDCTYDVVHVWKGRFFRLDRHLDRFLRSIEKLRMTLPFDRAGLEDVLHKCVALTGLEDSYVNMTCTRGRPLPGSRDPRSAKNNFYCFAVPFVWLATLEEQRRGLSMHISSIPRIPPDSIDPTIKNYNRLDFQMSLIEACEAGAEFVVLRDFEGNITEGLGYNVFALHGGKWTTPSKGVLEGITRQTVLDLCRELNVSVETGVLTERALRGADEILVTSTAGGIMPVVKLDGKAIGDGAPGPVTTRLQQLYWAKHADPAWSTPVRRG